MKLAVVTICRPGASDNPAFAEVSDLLCAGLTELGHDTASSFNVIHGDRINIVLGACLLHPEQQLPAGTILFNLEQLTAGSPWLTPGYVAHLRRHRIWDYSHANLSALSALGIAARNVPLGYSERLARIVPESELHDVLFYGLVNERRAAVLNDLRAYGLKVKVLQDVHGAARDAEIAKARIVLNLHYYDSRVFEAARVFYLLSNRRFVVSENGADHRDETQWKEGLVFADDSRIVDVCMDYLERPEDRRVIAERGFELIRARPMAQILDAALRDSNPV